MSGSVGRCGSGNEALAADSRLSVRWLTRLCRDVAGPDACRQARHEQAGSCCKPVMTNVRR